MSLTASEGRLAGAALAGMESVGSRGLWARRMPWMGWGLCAIALAVPAIPLLAFDSIGISLADAPNHIRWLYGFHRGLASGHWLPTWIDTTNAGFGSYPFEIYGRVTYLWLTPFYLLTGNLWSAIQLGVVAAAAMGALLTYRLGSVVFDRPASLALVAAYMGAPYLSFVMFAKFSVTGYMAFCLMPWVMERLIRLVRVPSWASVAWFALSLAVLMLTHVLLGAIYCIALVAVAVGNAAVGTGVGHDATTLEIRRARVSLICRVAFGFTLALGASAFSWTFLVFAPEGRSMAEVFSHEGDQFGHFVFSKGCWLIPDAAVPAMLILCVVAALMAWSMKPLRERLSPVLRPFWWVMIGVASGGLLIQTGGARWIWDTLPLLREVNRPHRFNAAVQLPAALLLVGSLDASWRWLLCQRSALGQRASRTLARWTFVAFAGALLGNLCLSGLIPWYLQGSRPLSVDSLPAFSPDESEHKRETPPQARIASVMERERYSAWRIRGEGVSDVKIHRWLPEHREFSFESAGGAVDIRTFHYRGWRLDIDGYEVPTRPGEPYGQIQFSTNPGHHQGRLTLAGTPVFQRTAWLSGICWIVIAAGPLISRRRSIRR